MLTVKRINVPAVAAVAATDTTPEVLASPARVQTVITIDGLIDSKEQMIEGQATLIECADLTNIATLREHFEKKDGEKTETVVGYFLDFQQRLPGMHAATYAGAKTYTKNANVKISLFQIQDSPYATADKPAHAEAASIDAKTLAEKLAAARKTAGVVAAAKAAAK